MNRVVAGSCLFLLLLGCTRDEDYLEIAREQRSAWKEMADVLASIKDEASMAAAKNALDEKTKQFEFIAKRASAMPAPSASVAKRLEEDSFLTKQTFERLRSEVARVNKMPGGAEFLKQFSARSPGLFSAVTP